MPTDGLEPSPVTGVLALTREWRIERARELAAVGRLWHTQRALGLLARERTVKECGTQAAAVGYCADCGRVHVQARRCGDRHVCGACAGWKGKQTYVRAVPAVERMVRNAESEWNARGKLASQRPRVRMLTLTTDRTGTLAERRALIMRAWGRHRAWLYRRANPRAARKMGLPRSRLRYVLVWQMTPGADGLGHPHAHVVTVFGWYSYKDARAAWIGHTDGQSTQYDVTTSTQGREHQAANAARYLAKYIAAGCDVEAELGEELGAEWWIATYNKRALSAHRGAWLARNAHCGDCGSVDLSWTPAKGDLDRVTNEARGPPVPWAQLEHAAEYIIADVARTVSVA